MQIRQLFNNLHALRQRLRITQLTVAWKNKKQNKSGRRDIATTKTRETEVYPFCIYSADPEFDSFSLLWTTKVVKATCLLLFNLVKFQFTLPGRFGPSFRINGERTIPFSMLSLEVKEFSISACICIHHVHILNELVTRLNKEILKLCWPCNRFFSPDNYTLAPIWKGGQKHRPEKVILIHDCHFFATTRIFTFSFSGANSHHTSEVLKDCLRRRGSVIKGCSGSVPWAEADCLDWSADLTRATFEDGLPRGLQTSLAGLPKLGYFLRSAFTTLEITCSRSHSKACPILALGCRC